MKWGRFGAFLAIVIVVLGLAAGTTTQLWKTMRLGLDLKGGFDLVYEIVGSKQNPITSSGIQAALQAVQLRVNETGVASPIIQLENGKYIRVELAGTFNQLEAEKIIGQTADLRMYGDVLKDAKGQTLTKNGQPVPDPKTLLMTGRDLKSNSHWAQDQNGQNVVVLNYKSPTQWENITRQYLNKPIYIYLNGKLLTDPVIQQVMPQGSSEIYGGNLNTAQACETLAKELNAGALPYPLKAVSTTNVGPSLGLASLKATMWAGLAAIIIIFLFMIWLYRLAGLIADIALIAYAYLMLVTFSGAQVVLTLPGLAAVVLGIGMAVDANIITYERIKDEMRGGKSLQSSVISGNRRALRTILDANITTFLAGAVMFWFGQGDIRGFAIALMLSIVISLLTAVLLSRAMLLLFTRSNATRNPWWFGIGKGVYQK